MKLAEVSINRPIMMTMVIMTFVVLGLFSLTRLGIDIFPDVEFPFVIATVIYGGAGPEEMETLVSEPIEEEVASIGGIKNVTSFSQESVSLVVCEFDLDVQADLAAIDVKDKIDLIRNNLPEDIQDPIIQKFDFASLPIITLAVSSPRPLDDTYRIADETIKQALARIRGLASIELTGGLEREIQINLSRRKLRAFDLSPQVVIMQIAMQNLNIPAGRITEGKKEITVRMAGEFEDLDQLRQIEIPLGEGKSVRLDKLGWIEDTFKEQRDRAYFNGESSVGVSLIKRSDANTVATAQDVYKALKRIRSQLPDDVQIDIARDSSTFIQDSVDDIFGNILIGILLTALVLMVFLHNLPATVIAALSMPVSLIATFILVDFAGFSLNFMSLLGLAVSVGILVANSIVIIENIDRFKRKGLSAPEASLKGTSEIAVAVAASTLTNVVVFAPMAFMSGIVGRFFMQFGLTVAFATVFSLLVSFTLTPMMSSRPIKWWIYLLMGGGMFFVLWWRLGIDAAMMLLLVLSAGALADSYGWLGKLANLWNRFYDGLVEDYRGSLIWVLGHKFIVLTTVTLLFVGSLVLAGSGLIGSEFFPAVDQGMFTVTIEMPVGTSLEHSDRTITAVSKKVMAEKYVRTVYVTSGKTEGQDGQAGADVNQGMITVQMVDADKRPMTTAAFIVQLTPKLTDFPDAKLQLKETSPFGGGGGESDLQIEITGYETDQLLEVADSVMAYMAQIGGLINIESSWILGKPELTITPDRTRLNDKGSSPAQLGGTLRYYIEGEVASKFREKGEEYDIRVQLDPHDVSRSDDIESVYIPTENGQSLLGELANIEYREGPTTIARKNKQRLVTVTANVSSGTSGGKATQLQELTDQLKIPEGYKIFYGGETEMMVETFTELFKALGLAILLTFMLLAAILESMKHPFTIMLTFPLALIGVIAALFLSGKSLSMFSMMALVMLVGIVVNNGILLIDYITRLREEGKGLDEAIIEGCPVRLRPILMTNIATALGVLPLALGLGSGGEFRAPMGIVTIGGLVTSTLFTLYIIPVIYRLFERKEVSA